MATPFVHHAQAQSTFKPPLIANENAFLGDVASRFFSNPVHRHYVQMTMMKLTSNQTQSDQNNPEKPIAGGFFRLEKGTPLVYEYTYDEMKIILEGDFAISDENGQAVQARPGDVFYFPKGSKITFQTESGGLAFFVGFRFLFPPGVFVVGGTADVVDWTTGSCMRAIGLVGS